MQENLTTRVAFEAWYSDDANAQMGGMSLTPEKMAALREGCGYGIHRNMLNAKWLSWQAAHEAVQIGKDAEIAALTAQLASFARGVKISIPTETMEYEFHQHFKRGAASKAAEIAALRSTLTAMADELNTHLSAGHASPFSDATTLQARAAMTQVVQPTQECCHKAVFERCPGYPHKPF